MAQLDAWGLEPQPVDPPGPEPEIGYTTDGEGWAIAPPRSTVTRSAFVSHLAVAGLVKLRYTLIKHWHRPHP